MSRSSFFVVIAIFYLTVQCGAESVEVDQSVEDSPCTECAFGLNTAKAKAMTILSAVHNRSLAQVRSVDEKLNEIRNGLNVITHFRNLHEISELKREQLSNTSMEFIYKGLMQNQTDDYFNCVSGCTVSALRNGIEIEKKYNDMLIKMVNSVLVELKEPIMGVDTKLEQTFLDIEKKIKRSRVSLSVWLAIKDVESIYGRIVRSARDVVPMAEKSVQKYEASIVEFQKQYKAEFDTNARDGVLCMERCDETM